MVNNLMSPRTRARTIEELIPTTCCAAGGHGTTKRELRTRTSAISIEPRAISSVRSNRRKELIVETKEAVHLQNKRRNYSPPGKRKVSNKSESKRESPSTTITNHSNETELHVNKSPSKSTVKSPPRDQLSNGTSKGQNLNSFSFLTPPSPVQVEKKLPVSPRTNYRRQLAKRLLPELAVEVDKVLQEDGIVNGRVPSRSSPIKNPQDKEEEAGGPPLASGRRSLGSRVLGMTRSALPPCIAQSDTPKTNNTSDQLEATDTYGSFTASTVTTAASSLASPTRKSFFERNSMGTPIIVVLPKKGEQKNQDSRIESRGSKMVENKRVMLSEGKDWKKRMQKPRSILRNLVETKRNGKEGQDAVPSKGLFSMLNPWSDSVRRGRNLGFNETYTEIELEDGEEMIDFTNESHEGKECIKQLAFKGSEHYEICASTVHLVKPSKSKGPEESKKNGFNLARRLHNIKAMIKKSDIDICQACKEGDETRVKEALQQNPTSIHQLSSEGFSPLYYASKNGHTRLVFLLLSKGAFDDNWAAYHAAANEKCRVLLFWAHRRKAKWSTSSMPKKKRAKNIFAKRNNNEPKLKIFEKLSRNQTSIKNGNKKHSTMLRPVALSTKGVEQTKAIEPQAKNKETLLASSSREVNGEQSELVAAEATESATEQIEENKPESKLVKTSETKTERNSGQDGSIHDKENGEVSLLHNLAEIVSMGAVSRPLGAEIKKHRDSTMMATTTMGNGGATGGIASDTTWIRFCTGHSGFNEDGGYEIMMVGPKGDRTSSMLEKLALLRDFDQQSVTSSHDDERTGSGNDASGRRVRLQKPSGVNGNKNGNTQRRQRSDVACYRPGDFVCRGGSVSYDDDDDYDSFPSYDDQMAETESTWSISQVTNATSYRTRRSVGILSELSCFSCGATSLKTK